MRLLVQNVGVAEWPERDDCDYVLLDMDVLRSELLKLKERIAPLFDIPGFYAASFFHYGFDIIELAAVADADWFDEDADVQPVPDGVVVQASENCQADAPTIQITPEGFHWDFYAKNSNLAIQTMELDWSRLDANTDDQGQTPAE